MFLGAGAILLQVLSVAVLLALCFGPKKNKIVAYADQHFLPIGFAIAFFSSLFSLVYSEIIGFLPCYLCWYQRVFLFPLVFMFGTALWDKDRKIIRYALPLIIVGFVISVYQNLGYYFGGESNAPCDASGISCYQQLVSEFGGYISIPMLSLTVYFALLVLCLAVHFHTRRLAKN